MAGEDWSEEEIRKCVEAYFEHLILDIRGESFNKAKLYRELAEEIPRTVKSIEFKFQNISAILDKLGVEWIKGLAPLNNFQRALALSVENSLPDFLSTQLHSEVDGLNDPAAIYIDRAPERATRPEVLPEYVERLVRKFDPIERDHQNRALGEAGEAFAMEIERHILRGHDRRDLASKVRWISKEDGDGAGYDILSYQPNGDEKFVEVKTTHGGNRTPFFITKNETEFSREAGDRYRLLRLYDFRRQPKAFEMIGAVDKYVRLTADLYKADFEA